MRFGDYEVTVNPESYPGQGERYEIAFPNGYGASIVRGPHTYGGPAGLWELAVLKGDDLTYDTPITTDVEGHLTEGDVEGLLTRIEALT